MKTNPILEEAWRTKDQLAAQAGYDVDRFVEQLRAWSAANPPAGPIVRNAGELRRLLTDKERSMTETSGMALNEKPPQKN